VIKQYLMSCFDVSDNADCVACFSLISYWCSFIHRLNILPVSSIYTCPQEQNILYTPAKLSGSLWSLGFLKIYPIFLGDLKIVEIRITNNQLNGLDAKDKKNPTTTYKLACIFRRRIPFHISPNKRHIKYNKGIIWSPLRPHFANRALLNNHLLFL